MRAMIFLLAAILIGLGYTDEAVDALTRTQEVRLVGRPSNS